MTKFIALFYNITISLALLLLIFLLIYFVWYPQPFFESDGGWQGIKILAGVEIILGPLLFSVIYNPGKTGLKQDIAILSTIRILALTAGIWIIHHERPVAAVYADGYFSTITKSQLESRQYNLSKLSELGTDLPIWIFADLPRSIDELQKLRLKALQKGVPIYLFTEFYRPMDRTAIDAINAYTFESPSLANIQINDSVALQHFMARYQDTLDNYVLVPWHSRYSRKIIVLDAKTMAYVEGLDVRPATASLHNTDANIPLGDPVRHN